MDVIGIGISIRDIRNDPRNLWNWAALGADVVCLAAPVATGGGRLVKGAENADDVYDVVKNSDSLNYFFKNSDEIADSLKIVSTTEKSGNILRLEKGISGSGGYCLRHI